MTAGSANRRETSFADPRSLSVVEGCGRREKRSALHRIGEVIGHHASDATLSVQTDDTIRGTGVNAMIGIRCRRRGRCLLVQHARDEYRIDGTARRGIAASIESPASTCTRIIWYPFPQATSELFEDLRLNGLYIPLPPPRPGGAGVSMIEGRARLVTEFVCCGEDLGPRLFRNASIGAECPGDGRLRHAGPACHVYRGRKFLLFVHAAKTPIRTLGMSRHQLREHTKRRGIDMPVPK